MTSPIDVSPPWCKRLLFELDASDARAIGLAKALTVQQLNWRASPHEWSVGQCLEHLAVANEVYLGPILKAIEGRPQAVAEEITPGWLGRWFIRNYIEPSAVTRRAKAPKKIAPAATVDASILDRFLATNRSTRDVINRSRHIDVNRVRFVNPFAPVIRFTVGTGFEILSKHQRRHLLQAERIKASPGFPDH